MHRTQIVIDVYYNGYAFGSEDGDGLRHPRVGKSLEYDYVCIDIYIYNRVSLHMYPNTSITSVDNLYVDAHSFDGFAGPDHPEITAPKSIGRIHNYTHGIPYDLVRRAILGVVCCVFATALCSSACRSESSSQREASSARKGINASSMRN